jgi:hypothetical protein
MRKLKTTSRREARHARESYVRFLERRTGEALFGAAPLRMLVAEWLPGNDRQDIRPWNPGIVRDEANKSYGVIGAQTELLPVTTNVLRISAAGADSVVLDFPLAESSDDLALEGDFAIYVDADGPGGRQALEAFAVLQACQWQMELPPRPGIGPLWPENDDGRGVPSLPLPYDERFARIAVKELRRSPKLRIRTGRAFVSELLPCLRKRLRLNHVALGSRTLERIEPDPRDAARPIRLEGPCPLLLDVCDIRTGERYFDERYVSACEDRSRLVYLTRSRDRRGTSLGFLGEPVPNRYLRVAYWRHLDLRDASIVPGRTSFTWNQQENLRAVTSLHPRDSRRPMIAQSRRAFLTCFTAPKRPHYPSRTEIARAVRQAMPAFLKRWLPLTPTPAHPLGMSLDLRPLPDESTHALSTWDIGLIPVAAAQGEDLESTLPWLSELVAKRLGDGFPIRIRFLGEGERDE